MTGFYKTFILSWDMLGLESCIDVDETELNRTFAVLSDTPHKSESVQNILRNLTMRARFNSQRHYEIYSVKVDASVTKDDLVSQFNTMPQEMADLIRQRGNKLYCNRTITVK
jgi:cytidylate kinase